MKVRCINNWYSGISSGTIYDVIYSSPYYFSIINDYNSKGCYKKDYFEIIEEEEPMTDKEKLQQTINKLQTSLSKAQNDLNELKNVEKTEIKVGQVWVNKKDPNWIRYVIRISSNTIHCFFVNGGSFGSTDPSKEDMVKNFRLAKTVDF